MVELKTYDNSGLIVVKMLETIELDNLRYLSGKMYKLDYAIAVELANEGLCIYQLKPMDWLKEFGK